MDHSQMLGNFGFCYTLEWRGHDLLFSFMSDRQRAWFEHWLKQSEFEAIEKNEFITDAQRSEMRAKFVRDVKNGVFKFGGSRFKEAMETPEGQTRFLMMLLVEHHPEFTVRDIEELAKDKRRELTAIIELVGLESSNELTEVTPSEREILTEELYGRFILPEAQGGLGLDLDTVSRLTDKQKIALVKDSIRRNDPDASVREKRQKYTKDEAEEIDRKLRAFTGT